MKILTVQQMVAAEKAADAAGNSGYADASKREDQD
jgi:hypothetical protein